MPSPVEFAEVLRQRIDIVDVVGSYVPLKAAGANHKGCCPFHQEKTPSFTVHQGKQIYHCFGCGKGGDLVKFVCEIEHLQFTDALRFLADKYGIPVPSFSSNPKADKGVNRDKRKSLLDACIFAQNFFALQLQAEISNPNTEAAQYIAKRGLTAELCGKFQLGLAPVSGWQQLQNAAQKAHFSNEILSQAGLLVEREGRVYDRFRNRIMFPIHDTNGSPVAFGGRVYHSSAKQDDPKYINSPETELYKKGQQLYAFHLARPVIREKTQALLMEGYLDVIRCHQYGFSNAVATCGTALTQDQARLLKRFTKRIALVYDGDSAGQKAMIRAAEILLPMEFELRFVVLPEKHDPDSFLREAGKEAFQALLDRGLDTLSFLSNIAEQQFSTGTPESKVNTVAFIAPHLLKIPNAILREEYIRHLADRLSISQNSIVEVLRNLMAGHNAHNAGEVALRQDSIQRRSEPRNETLLLKTFMEYPEARRTIYSNLELDWLTGPRTRALFNQLFHTPDWPDTWTHLMDHCPDETLRAFCSEVALMDIPEITHEVLERGILEEVLLQLIGRLAFFYHKMQAGRLALLMRTITTADDGAEILDKFLQEFDKKSRLPFGH